MIPCDHGHPCQRQIVQHAPDDVVGVCDNEDGFCEKRQVSRKERLVYRLDEERLFAAILKAAGGKPATPEVIADRPRLQQIGGVPTTGDSQLLVFFALASDSAAVDVAVTALLAHGAEKFLLIVPEAETVGLMQESRASQRRARIIGLDQLLDVTVGGEVSARASGQELVGQWLGKSAPKAPRDAEAARFPTPPGTQWKDVTITFEERDIIEIKCGNATAVTRERLHIPGMADATKREKGPTDKWFLLMAFAARGPTLNMSDLEKFYGSRNREMIKKQKSDLSLALQDYFGIKEPPIKYKAKGRCYCPVLTIREDDNVDLEVWLEKWLVNR